MSTRPSLRQALRANLVPAGVLWTGSALLLAGHRHSPAVRAALDQLAATKAAWGWAFVLPAQACAGGVLPWLIERTRRDLPAAARTPLSHLPWLMLVWAALGALTDRFYAGQALLFGDSPAPGVILAKTAVDMLLYTPLVCSPLIVFAHAFRQAGFDPVRLRLDLRPGWYRVRVLPVYRAALLIWTPAVCVLYALPLALQFPVQVGVQAFFALVAAALSARAR
jgi:hypothetical protein